MKWPFPFKGLFARKPPAPSAQPSLTQCSVCGREMELIEKTTMTGNDMRTYRCAHCQREEVVDFGKALWQVLSEAREKDDAP